MEKISPNKKPRTIRGFLVNKVQPSLLTGIYRVEGFH